MKGLLRDVEWRTGSPVHLTEDTYGFRWAIFRERDLKNLVGALHRAALALWEQGQGGRLLAALFPFRREDGRVVHWVYSFRRDRFYPFAPEGEGRRDSELELSLAALVEGQLPVERRLEAWYPLWGAPLDSAPAQEEG